jgi:hypothetical protein
MECLDALNLVFLGIHYAESARKASADKITHNRAARLVNVVRATDYYDALRV